MARTATDVNFTVIAKGGERYVFVWVESQRAELMAKLAHFAQDENLSFTWYDAVCVANKITKEPSHDREL